MVLPMLACGSALTASDDSGTDGAAGDVTVGSDAGSDAMDANADAALGDSGTPIQLQLKCAEADSCDGSVCCASLGFGNDCLLDSVTAACAPASECPTTLEPFCTKTETVRLCDKTADCTEPGYDRCCTFDITGHAQSVTMCASEAMANAADASCAE